MRKHLEAAAPRSAAAREVLEGPPLPADLAYLWAWFCDLAAGTEAEVPISYTELTHWIELTGARPSAWDIGTIRAIDAAWHAKPEPLTIPEGPRGNSA